MEQNLSLYRIFYTVAKVGNISHAAKELYISQPAISKAISKLEANLGTSLFTRNSRGVILNEEGNILFGYIKSAFDSISLGEESIKRITDLGIGHIRIGVSTTLCKYILLPYLKSFIETYPHIKISIQCQSTIHTLKLLETNAIDIGLIGQPKNTKNIDFYPVDYIEDIFITTQTYLDNLELREYDHTKTDSFIPYNGQVNSKEIFKYSTLMLLEEDNITRLYIEDYFKENEIEINQILEINNMDLLIEFAKISLGVACVIKDFVKEDLCCGNIIEIPLSSRLKKRAVGFAYHKNTPISLSMQNFIDFYKTN